MTTRPGREGVPRWSSLGGKGELGTNGVFGLGEGGNGDCIPGLPESTHVAGYVAGDAEVWDLGRLVRFIGMVVGL